MAKGLIFNIQQFSVYDGPGIRTTVFFKGCNMRCIWCHNPESIQSRPELQYYNERCISCGSCFVVCPQSAHIASDVHTIDRKKCVGCGVCADSCYAKALVMTGSEVTAEEVMRLILRDKIYYDESGGGVTFSGGECMLQVDFLRLLLSECKKNAIHTAVDTAGNIPFWLFEKITDICDLFLYDLKAFDDDLHTQMTGSSNRLILENLQQLAQKCDVIVRIPLVLGGNVNAIEDMTALADFLKGLCSSHLLYAELLPFHMLGEGKANALGIEKQDHGFQTPTNEQLHQASDIFTSRGIKTKI